MAHARGAAASGRTAGGLARCFAGAADVPPQDPQDVVPGGVLPGGGGKSGGAGVVALCGRRAGLAAAFRAGGRLPRRPLARGVLRCQVRPGPRGQGVPVGLVT